MAVAALVAAMYVVSVSLTGYGYALDRAFHSEGRMLTSCVVCYGAVNLSP